MDTEGHNIIVFINKSRFSNGHIKKEGLNWHLLYSMYQGLRKCQFFSLKLIFEELERTSLQKDIKNFCKLGL